MNRLRCTFDHLTKRYALYVRYKKRHEDEVMYQIGPIWSPCKILARRNGDIMRRSGWAWTETSIAKAGEEPYFMWLKEGS